MGKVLLRILLLVLLSGVFVTSRAQEIPLEAYWDDGLRFRSKGGLHVFAVGGRLHYDIAFLNQEEALDSLFEEVTDGTEVRRARISFEGIYNGVLAYEFEVDLEENIEYADMYLAFLRVPYVDLLMLGHFREPFGLEEMTSSNVIPFMERSLSSAFGPSRNVGVMLQKHFLRDRLGVYAGAFRITDDLGSDLGGEGSHAYTARLTYGTVLDTAANSVLHMGVAGSTRQPQNGIYEVEIVNEANTSIRYISTGALQKVDRVQLLGGEGGYSTGPLTLQAEYIRALVRFMGGTGLPERTERYDSYYIMASYFLSGGQREYDPEDNEFSDIKLRPGSARSLEGAWEVGLRYSFINLVGSAQQFRQMRDITFGVNWYLNTSTRLMMNYILTRLEREYSASALQFRVQIVF